MQQQFPSELEFVRADHYFTLYNEAHDLPWNLNLSDKIDVTAAEPSQTLDALTDGTPTTSWKSSNPEDRLSTFDLKSPHRLTRYVLRHTGESALPRNLNTRGFVVQVSLDNKAWTTIDAVKNNTANVTDVDVTPVTARYLRLQINDAGEDDIARIADVEIYGNKTP